MSDDLSAPPQPGLTTTQWLICIMAAIGFAFDTYELLMLPLVAKTAISSLSGVTGPDAALWAPGGAEFVKWARMLFFVPAIAGGVFGLLGGYLTDRLGRRRVLTWSILLYAFGAMAAGLSTSLPMLLVCRCCVFVGVCVEFVAAVAWLAELFPNAIQREKVLGYTQACSSFGGLMVAEANILSGRWAESLPAIHGGHEAWRYTLISGLIPAIPLMLIRPFLPESPAWQAKKAAGTLKRPSIMELFSPQLLFTTVVTTIGFAATFGLAFGAIQQNPQILPGHVDIKKIGDDAEKAAKDKVAADAAEAKPPTGTEEEIAKKAEQAKKAGERRVKQARANAIDPIVAGVQLWQEVGGLVGRFILAYVALLIVSRRNLLRLFQLPSLIFLPLLYWWMSQHLQDAGSLTTIKWGMFIAGALVIGQMSFWGNYIPLVFPMHLRGTGESFAANIGGRVLGTAASWFTITFSESKPPNPGKIAMVGATVALVYAICGAIANQLLVEPKPEENINEG